MIIIALLQVIIIALFAAGDHYRIVWCSWPLPPFLLQVIKMLVIVVALFALCWLPLQTYNVLQYIYPEINQYVLGK
jgi:hypothetical protein